jgi:hypothetical protein
VYSDISLIPDNAIKIQKSNIDNIFCEKLRNIKTIDEVNSLFKDYITFFDAYQQFITEDFATLFLNKIHSDVESATEIIVKEAKEAIDAIFFKKIGDSKSIDEISNLFENYLAFFDNYQEFIID